MEPGDEEEQAGRCTMCVRCCLGSCYLLCCPPCPGAIAAKMAFLPPEPTYEFRPRGPGGQLEMCLDPGLLAGGEPLGFRHFEPYIPLHVLPAIRTRRRNKIAGIYLEMPDAKLCLVFSHGNAVDIGIMVGNLTVMCAQLGCSVFTYDYSGYGRSTGKPREKNLYADIEAAIEALKHEFNLPAGRLVLYGQSIGTAPTVDYASRHPEIAGVILHSPMASGLRVLKPSMRRTYWCDPFPNIKKIHRIGVPMLILHGRQDEVVEFSNGQLLHSRSAPTTTQALWLDGGHNDLEDREAFQNGLANFFSTIVPKE